MTDITTRLRQRLITHWIQGTGETPHASGYSVDKECQEAADEIERLRELVAERCPCGDRAAAACPGEWEKGCDLGANEKHAQPAQARTMTVTGAGAAAEERGHWYSPAAVREMVAAERERCAEIAEGFDACDTRHIAAAIRGA
jgi:hypothetical protein